MGIPQKRRRDSRLLLLYKGLKGKASIPDDRIPLVRRCRNDHSMAYQVPIANTDIYKCSFPRPIPPTTPTKTIRDWNQFQTLLSPLLKVHRMVFLSSLLWWELGARLPGHGSGEWLSFRRVTSKQFWVAVEWFWLVYRYYPTSMSDWPRSPSSSWLNDFVAYVWTCIVGFTTKDLQCQCFNDLDYLTDMTGTCSIGLFFMRQSLVSSAPTCHIFTSGSYPQRRGNCWAFDLVLTPRGIFAFTCRDLGGALNGF